jgi:hypothetical protein
MARTSREKHAELESFWRFHHDEWARGRLEPAGIICFCLIVAPWRDDGPENLPCRDHPICLSGDDGVQWPTHAISTT